MKLIEKVVKRIRILLYRLRYKDTLNLPFSCRCIEKDVRFEIEPKGKINIGPGLWIRDSAELWCINNATLDIGKQVFINSGTIISSRKHIKIGDNTIMGPNVMIYDHDHDYRNSLHGFVEGEIEIGRHVWIGANACILKNVVIGDHCVIGAGTVVTKSIPPYSIVYGQKDLIIRKIEGVTYDS